MILQIYLANIVFYSKRQSFCKTRNQHTSRIWFSVVASAEYLIPVNVEIYTWPRIGLSTPNVMPVRVLLSVLSAHVVCSCSLTITSM